VVSRPWRTELRAINAVPEMQSGPYGHRAVEAL
jgi:hypothetical protein